MRIGELAALAEINIQTVRFYEREGLLCPPMRTSAGYRRYEEADLERVRFIRKCQSLGFTLREISVLLQLHRDVSASRGTVPMKLEAVKEIVIMANERMAAIDEKLQLLSSMRAELAKLVESLTATSPAVCPAGR